MLSCVEKTTDSIQLLIEQQLKLLKENTYEEKIASLVSAAVCSVVVPTKKQHIVTLKIQHAVNSILAEVVDKPGG